MKALAAFAILMTVLGAPQASAAESDMAPAGLWTPSVPD